MTVVGIWEPHTSSIDFCEPNYLLTRYVAEPHNVWSSFVLVALGLVGVRFGNSTREWRFTVQFGALSIVGLGSMALHCTLASMWQAADEVPMMWQNIIAFYVLLESHSAKGKNRGNYIPHILIILGIAQTLMYYTMQKLYTAFLFSYIVSLAVVIIWTHITVFEDPRPEVLKIRKSLWMASVTSLLLIGTTLWIFDMNCCDYLTPIYMRTAGATLHVIWHVSAGVASYLGTVLMTVMRIQNLGMKEDIRWICGILPIAVISKKN